MADEEMKAAHCKSCSAPIFWTWTKRRAKMPVDAKPIDPVDFSGSPANVYALLARPGEDPLALNLREIADGVDLWTSGDIAGRLSHFATCPNSAEHRKPREPGKQLAQRPA